MAAEEGRARSRSRAREPDESEAPAVPEEIPSAPEGAPAVPEEIPSAPEGAPAMPEEALGMPERAPDEMTDVPPPASGGTEILELAQKLSESATKIGKVIEDLGLVFDEFNNGRLELQKGFQELSTQIKGTNHCITTMTAGVAFQAGEVTKLLKAFDGWLNTSRWAMAGSQTIETNIKGVQGEIEKQAERLGASMNGSLETLGGHIQELVNLLKEQPWGPAFPPAAPGSAPEGVTETGTPLTPGVVGFPTVGAPVAGGPGVPGVSGAYGAAGMANTGESMMGPPGHVPATPPAPSVPPAPAVPPVPAVPPRAADSVPLSLFMAYCPEHPSGQRPSGPLGIATPSQRVGIVTRDAGTGALRTLSPTAYRSDQITGITSLWAPQGLGMIRDGNSQFRRIY